MRYRLGGWVIGFSIGFIFAALFSYLFAKNSILIEYVYNGSMFKYMINRLPGFIGVGCIISIWGFIIGHLIGEEIKSQKGYDHYKEHFDIDYSEKD